MALMRAWVGLEIVPGVDEEGARRSSRLPCALSAQGPSSTDDSGQH